jgi:hypothetical protein
MSNVTWGVIHHLPRHPLAAGLALVIYAENCKDSELEYGVHEVLTRSVDMIGWSDTRKADLYAMLAERLDKGMTFHMFESCINKTLWDNQNRFA